MPGPRKPKTLSREEANTNVRAQRRYDKWASSDEGQRRLSVVSDANPGRVYQEHGWRTAPESPHWSDISHTNEWATPEQPRWEELHPHHQAATLRALRRHGVDLDSMEHHFGAQLDQSFQRAQPHFQAAGEPETVPLYRHFYSTGEQATAVHDLATKHAVPHGLASQTVAITSPNTKWQVGDRHPNIEAADHVIRHVLSGGSPETAAAHAYVRDANDDTIMNETGPRKGRPKKIEAVGTNMVRAAQNVHHWLLTGGPQARVPGLGPKTAPFHNALLPNTQDFLVGDVHTGGSMFPHLGTEKRVLNPHEVLHPETGRLLPLSVREERGVTVKREKSEREKAIATTPHFHAAADYAARQAMEKRGLPALKSGQAMQWGEEQMQRQEKNPRLGLPTEEQAYGHLRHRNLGAQFSG